MNYINSITEAIGNTPLMKLNKIGKDVDANIFVKLEHLNPSGSYKDRMALSMVEAAERGDTWNGKKLDLEKGGCIVEASAGNTAPAVSMVCAAKGIPAKIYLYRYQVEGEKTARYKITEAFGPEVCISSEPEKYLTEEQIAYFKGKDPSLLHVLSAKMDCQIVEDTVPGSVWLDQIYNVYNLKGQKKLGEEIYEQLDGKIDAIGASASSGASLYGMCLGLKEKGLRPELVFGVTPYGSEQYLDFDGEEANREDFRVTHTKEELAEAIGLKKWVTEDPILKLMMDDGYPDKFFRVTAEEARDMANRLCKEEGIFCGMSSGANVAIALKIAKRLGHGKNVVTTIVDRRDRYLSETPNEIYVV